METTATAMDMLEDICERNGVDILRSDAVLNGDTIYKHKLKSIYIGRYVNSKNTELLLKKLTEI